MIRPLVLTLAVALFAIGTPVLHGDDESPRPSDVVERAASRIVQLDISLLGRADRIAAVTAEDLTIKVRRKKIRDFTLDRLCEPETPSDAGDTGDAGDAVRGSYLFYFDQQQLTFSGRRNAIGVARDLIETLIDAGARVMLVSSGAELELLHPLGDDSASLLAALDALAADRTHWDWHAEGEASRVDEVIRALNDDDDILRAAGLARTFQKEELWRSNRSFRRLGLSIAPLKEAPSPRAVLYFADTIRSNPGSHFLSFFSSRVQERHAGLGLVSSGASTGGLAYDGVVNDAAAHGIRIYSVQGEGLDVEMDGTRITSRTATLTDSVGNSSQVRVRDTQSTLRDLSGETGGEAFLNGVPAREIARRLREDARCMVLATFRAEGLPLDSPLGVEVSVSVPGVRSRTRGRLVLQSEEAHRRSRLLQAFSAPGSLSDPLDVDASVVPIGLVDGEHRGLLQIRVPPVAFAGAAWDVGASVVADEKVREALARRVTLTRPGVPLVVEDEIAFRAGASSIVVVIEETGTGLIASREIDVRWPETKGGGFGLGPLAVLQPRAGAFVRGERTRREGPLSTGETQPLDATLPTVLVGLACRGRDETGWTVERTLLGATRVDYDPIALDGDAERCAQIRDVVPSGAFGAGEYAYEMKLVRNGKTLDSATRRFHVRTR